MSDAIDDIKKPRGRPKANSTAVLVRLPPEITAAVDALIAANDNDTQSKSGRPEAIRFIVRDWLERSGRL